MDFSKDLALFIPHTEEEEILKHKTEELLKTNGEALFTRACAACHLTSSGFVLNPEQTRVLFVHHNIYRAWSFAGGHADGERDLLSVALREAMEETGISRVRPLSEGIASLDSLPVPAHIRRSETVLAHEHINASYLLVCGEDEFLAPRLSENSGVRWMAVKDIARECGEHHMLPIYEKLLNRAKELK